MDLDIDDETLLIIEESNVSETLNDVIIYEEQIKDDSVLILNKDQITITGKCNSAASKIQNRYARN